MTEPTTLDFVLRVACALGLGTAIGLERQWRQRAAGLRTNVLVAVGAALFVALGTMTPGEASPTRIAAQVVSGIGFLGAGIMLREGVNVRGLNTAATLWCTAAVGTLAGAGVFLGAALGCASVIVANLAFRPVAQRMMRLDTEGGGETAYRVRIVCHEEEEAHIRTLLLSLVGTMTPTLRSLSSADLEGSGPPKVEVTAELTLVLRDDRQIEQLVSSLSLEAGVSAIRWEARPASGIETLDDV